MSRRSLRASAPRFLQAISLHDQEDIRTFECRVDGYPRPDIRWEKSGKVIGKSRRVHMVRTGDKCVLQIKSPQLEDLGIYCCTATNIIGMASTQVKVSTPYPIARKLNGISTHDNKTKSVHSRTIESYDVHNSSEKCAKSKSHRGMFRMRSQSGSSKTRDSNLSLPRKQPTFTSHISHEVVPNEINDFKNVEISMNCEKKRLCKSMEDCRKAKKSFFNRVKIPDIFNTPQKNNNEWSFSVNVLHPSQKLNGVSYDRDLVKAQKTKTDSKPLSNYPLNTDSVGNSIETPTPMTTRERISAYLKRFENSSTDKSDSIPDKIQKRNSSAKKRTDENKDSMTPSAAENETNFFSFAKFRRRKSSSSIGKNIKQDPSINIKSSDAGQIGNLKREINSVEQAVVEKCQFQTVGDEVFGDNVEIGDKNCVKEDFLEDVMKSEPTVVPLDKCPSEIDLNCLTFEQIDVGLLEEIDNFHNKNRVISEDSLRHEDKSVDENLDILPASEATWNGGGDIALPSIQIELSTEDQEEKEEGNERKDGIITANEIVPRSFDENRQSNVLFLTRPSKGNIKYSSPLIEEECESLLGDGEVHPVEILEETFQRVSSPVESPARTVKGPQSVTVLRGESVTLAISFTGMPTPRVIWMKGGRILSSGGRLSIIDGREMSVVTVNDVTADDSGKYVVSVENDGGGDSCFASVAVVGFPEPPGGEPTANEVTDHSLVLSWYGSMYDGGSVVTGYQVEMATLPDKSWHKVASSVNTSCSVQGLSKGQQYLFRIKAENRYGLSHPSKESKVIRLDDFLQYDSSSDEEPGNDASVEITIDSGTEFSERFDLKEEVGKGRFGIVYRCVEKSCGRPRAAKIIRCLKLKDKEKVKQEIEIMSRLHHPKLMQVLAAFESGRNMIMVMEYISGGELFERVIADDFVLTEQDCILFMRQICKGVAYMHENNIIHLDLKPENILCKTRTSHKIKIIDFGLARYYKGDESLRVLFGTPEFVAPEVINYEPVCLASDMWSVGVICYVLISGLSPFMGDSDSETFANITRGEMDFDDEAFDDISEDAKDFISRLLVKKLKSRMSAEECLQHPWLATASPVQKRPLSTEKLKRFIIRRKWQKSGTAIRALGRMVSLSRSSLGSSCDSYSPLGSPISSRSGSSLISRSETAESCESDMSHDPAR